MKEGAAQLLAQLAAAWKQLGFNQRVAVVIASGAILAGLVGLAAFSSRTSYALLYGRLDESEAARVITALDEAKINHQVRGSGIYVPADRVDTMRMQLAGKGIPRNNGSGYELFDKANFGISDFVQRANFKRAIEGELARAISQIDSIEVAKVMVVIPENRLMVDPQKKPTASVIVRVRGNATLPPASVNSIRFLVANSVEGLAANNVSVVDNQGNVLSENQDDNSLGGLSGNQLRARRELEQYLARKAEDMLRAVLGPGKSVVRVSAEINWDTRTTYEEKYDPETQVMRTSMINDEETRTSSAATGGAPGVASNTTSESTNAVASASTAPTTSNSTKKKVTNNQFDVNRTVSSLLRSAGDIRRLSAAVTVAQEFQGTGTERKAVPRTPEELQKLRRIVQSALGIQEADPARSDEITLEELPFNNQPAVELTQQLDRQQTRQYWTELGLKLIYPTLGLGVLLLFWRSFGRIRSEDLALGLPLGELNFKDAGGDGNGNGGRLHRGEPKVVTVDVLNQLIRENPANMTQAVRTWLTRGKPTK